MNNISTVSSSLCHFASDGNERIGAARSVDNLQHDDVSHLLRTSGSASQVGFSEATSSLSSSVPGGKPTLDAVIKRWHDERRSTFNKALALRTVRRLAKLRARSTFNNGEEMEELLDQWRSIPPNLAETAEGAATLWSGWDELSQSMSEILMSQIVPS